VAGFTRERWEALSPYLDQALDLSEQDRTGWLLSIAAQDQGIADDLRALLEQRAVLVRERFLEDRPSVIAGQLAVAGNGIGAYTLLTPIGIGGMGSVWLAERADGRFERRVAVKFLNIALAGRGEERFTREGRILASLTHPNIAQLVDAGVSEGARPYLIIEYVDGEPIDAYCNRHGLDVPARLALFLDLLAAVAYAHANLIVHRDIKPSNVFVDHEKHVKLLDFGIAKPLAEEPVGEATPLTREHGAAMTPEYAAPEQLTAGPVTTATDVYALGVLLYVLLTGRHPIGEALGSPAHMMQAITETDPLRPSDVAPEGIRRQLRGDLDTIVVKALKKNPAERYGSIPAFADDLRRHLRHEPIGARPDTIVYRSAKFVRRNRWPVAALALTVTGLSAGLYVANSERLIAQRRFAQLQQLSTRVFDFDRKIRGLPGSTQARQSLVAVSLEYLDGLAGEGRRDSKLTADLAVGYLRIATVQGVPTEANLGDFAAAEKNLEKADQLNDTLLVSGQRREALTRSVDIAESRMILAQSEHRRDEALTEARKTVDRLDAFLREGHPNDREREAVAIHLSNVAIAYVNMHLYDDGARNAMRCVDVLREVPSARVRMSCLSVLANARRYLGDLDGALQAITQARHEEDALASQDANFVFNQYGLLLREGLILDEDNAISLGRPKDAIAPLQKALDMNEAVARKDPNDATSRSRVGTAGRGLANILRHDDAASARAVYDLSIRRLEEIPNNLKARRDQAVTLAESSYALRALGDLRESRRRIEKALSILSAAKDESSGQVALGSDQFTVQLALLDQLADEADISRAIDVGEQLLGRVMQATPEPLADLRDAPNLSRLYATLEKLYRRTTNSANSAKAAQLKTERRELWQHWNDRLPDNPFVRRQLADVQ
jgi:serine/threonine protein kinase/tetratricopeptide (TPR) repeat protein